VWPFLSKPARLAATKPKTEELLYWLLWSGETFARPTFRNLTDSFEGWAYRNGLKRQLAELERKELLESLMPASNTPRSVERVVRLTEAGRLHALGGREPESRWRREWDGLWRLVLFDLPVGQDGARDRLRLSLRRHGFGYLQQSVWISPDTLQGERDILAGSHVDVESLIVLEARPGAGESDKEIVNGAWDFPEINRRYAAFLNVLKGRPEGPLRDQPAAQRFRKWAGQERAAWITAVTADPLLPEGLLPPDYLGRKAWQARVRVVEQVSEQLRSFQG
jgi:phenylacetic acid degradation operon negative regulatory protein